jgi:hypothetical protein
MSDRLWFIGNKRSGGNQHGMKFRLPGVFHNSNTRDLPPTRPGIAKSDRLSSTALFLGVAVLMIWLPAYGENTAVGQSASAKLPAVRSSTPASEGENAVPSPPPTTSPAAARPAPPAEGSKRISLSTQAGMADFNRGLTVNWETTYAPSSLAFFYSADDGRTWKLWREQPLKGQQSGSVDLPVGWPQFNWSYFSYSKIRDLNSQGQTQEFTARLFGNPLQVRISDPNDSLIKSSNVANVVVSGPPWAMPVYVGTFLFAMLLFYLKTRWEAGLRRDLSLVFNLTCFACLLSQTTFFLSFAIYLLIGLMIYHRFRIIKSKDRRKYWLVRIYKWAVIGVSAGSIAMIILGSVLRVRDLLF